MKHKKMSPMAQKISQAFTNPIQKKSIICFKWFRSYKFINETLQPRFFAKKMTGQKR
jgi:hypothetical protein